MYHSEQAELLAIQALGYIAGSHEELEKLMVTTGMDKAALMESAQLRDGLAGILDYVCQDDSILLGFCESAGVLPEEPMKALQALQKMPDIGAA
jgi:hypothetical protein